MLILASVFFGALFTLAVAWMLGNVCLYRLPVPWTITLAVGAAAESCVVFSLLAAGVGGRISFGFLGAVCALLFVWLRPGAPGLADPIRERADRMSAYLGGAALTCYGALYLINALAPELEPDAIGYHLGLTREYVRLGGFPNRVGFYEMLPQGLEMLFVPAFAFGRHSAARLVHCAFLLASVPLILSVARRLELPDRVGLAAAVLYFCAPMVGITGTSAYTDAGGVFFGLATFYLLLVWRDTRDARYLGPAGITAGMCYAIKFPGVVVVILAVVFVVWEGRAMRVRLVALVSGMALAMMAPWILRSAIMTGNPLAPLFNRLFPNPYFHPSMDRELAATLASFGDVPWWRVPFELIVGGRFNGTMGAAFFALPLGLLALRRRAGRLCWLAVALLALPWFWNTGARFLMPALPFLALALTMSLPRRALWACLAVQAVACWPQIVSIYHPAYTWRLERIPWRAALRIQPESDYVSELISGYRVARLVEDHTQPGDRIFSLISVPGAYTDRSVLEFWHSALADQLEDALWVALAQNDSIFDVTAECPARPVWGVRIRMPRAAPWEWQINNIALYLGASQVSSAPRWRFHAWPNAWEIPLAFDGNPATRWRTWEPIRRGMYVEADFDRAQMLSRVVMTSPTPLFGLSFDFYVREADGWRLLTSSPMITQKPLGDVRKSATHAILGAGFRYILASSGNEGNSVLGTAMAEHEADWGLEKAADLGPVTLFKIE